MSALEEAYPEAALAFDHFAFRTFGLPGLGITSAASLFTDFGYRRRGDALEFPAKKLQAYWYAPPNPELPRVFISQIQVREVGGRGRAERVGRWNLVKLPCVALLPPPSLLQVDQLSPEAQAVIGKYCDGGAGAGGGSRQLMGRYGAMASLLGVTPWCLPTLEDFQLLSRVGGVHGWVGGWDGRLGGGGGGVHLLVARCCCCLLPPQTPLPAHTTIHTESTLRPSPALRCAPPPRRRASTRRGYWCMATRSIMPPLQVEGVGRARANVGPFHAAATAAGAGELQSEMAVLAA